MDHQLDNEKIADPILVSIIVTAYNQLNYTKQCIENLYKHTPNIRFELITINNGSKDGTAEYFNSLPHKKKISFSENIGVDKAINYGIHMSEGIYTLNLSNDIIVTQNWLENLIICMESDPRIGMVVPTSSYSSNIQQVNLQYDTIDQMHVEAEKFNISNPDMWEDKLRLVTYTCLFRTEILKMIGGFDEDFNPGAFDDDAIGFRMRRAGYRLILAADTFVHHYGSVTFGEEYKKNDLMKRNRKLFEKKFGVDSWLASSINFNLVHILDYSRRNMESPIYILGIGRTCGASLLQIKNFYRKYGQHDVHLCYLAEEEKYITDLKTICTDVVLSNCSKVKKLFGNRKYDIIVVESETEDIENIARFYLDLSEILQENGQIITTAKPTTLPIISSALGASGLTTSRCMENYYYTFCK